jgi:hypothetical protein
MKSLNLSFYSLVGICEGASSPHELLLRHLETSKYVAESAEGTSLSWCRSRPVLGSHRIPAAHYGRCVASPQQDCRQHYNPN